MGLKILHISDIHFKNYKDFKYLDLDRDIQQEIEIDLRNLRAIYENIDIILIGGDIAFSGKSEEYLEADQWIKKVCEISGCKEENVLTVPGNHDIDRSKINVMLKSAHKEIKALRERGEIDSKIAEFIADSDSASALLNPLHNYRSFAQKYGSNPESANLLYWEKDFNLDNKVLRVRGVNSALVSDEYDDEYLSKLVLGSHQTTISRDTGVINLVLCHHPPQWLYDGDETQRDFKARAKIVLYGHKHSFDADRLNNTLVLSAGAMQPSRRESNWDPRYNIIDLHVDDESNNHILVRLYKRRWDARGKIFTAEFTNEGGIFEEFNLPLTAQESSENLSIKKDKENDVGKSDVDLKTDQMTDKIIDTRAYDPKRKLAYMFLGLTYHIKLTIAVKLKLIEDSDSELEETNKAQNYFKRANERGLLRELWDEVISNSNTKIPNPF